MEKPHTVYQPEERQQCETSYAQQAQIYWYILILHATMPCHSHAQQEQEVAQLPYVTYMPSKELT